MDKRFSQSFDAWERDESEPGAGFSGVFSVRGPGGVLYETAQGFRNRAEALPNQISTAFAIASGTKLFTALAACRLIESGKLSENDRVWDVLPYDLKRIDKDVTVYQLLTHTSGIGDYIDEESDNVVDDMITLYRKYPVYAWDTLAYYLPMFNELPPKFAPGARFGYSNAGFALLGMVVEAASGVPFRDYVRDTVIVPCGLTRTGFYHTNRLPGDTAYGYMHDEETGAWLTNIFHLPYIGGADGGLYTCAADLDLLWRAVFAGRVLSDEQRARMFAPVITHGDGESFYGLGVYGYQRNGHRLFYAVGGDFGVDFFTAYDPVSQITASALGNTQMNTGSLLTSFLRLLTNGATTV